MRALPAVLWTYVLSLALALLFSVRFYGQWDALLAHSLASQSLTSAFNLGTLAGGFLRLSEHVPGGNSPSFGGAIPFLVLYFLLVPGVLSCFASAAPARLSTLLSQGVVYFWRFVRITLLTLLVGGVVLAPLSAINTALSGKIDDHIVGRPAFLLECVGFAVLFLVASILRFFFDLVEVYTVQLGFRTLPDGQPDRRVRVTLKPAWRTMTRHFASGWLTFLLLALLGISALVLATHFVVASLAQPRVWPAFLLMQVAILFDLFTRFWQRGAETVLAQNHPLPAPAVPSRSAYVPRSATDAPPPPHAVETPAVLAEDPRAGAYSANPDEVV